MSLVPCPYPLYAVPAMTKPRSSRVSGVPTRRQFIGASAAAIAAAAGRRITATRRPAPAGRSKADQGARRGPRFAYLGTFTSGMRNARGEGLSAYRIDPESGRWVRVQLLNREVNPSYLAVDPKRQVLYAVHS